MNTADYERLNREKRKIADKFEKPLRLRVHRAISWGRRAQQAADDVDARFIFLWIGFNSLYSIDLEAGDKKALNEIRNYLKGLVPLNPDLIHSLFWKGAVFNAGISLMEDEYLYKPFWRSQDGWRAGWDAERTEFIGAESPSEMQKAKIPEILAKTIFDRLYVLRNQVMHGSATHESQYNRTALYHGVKVLERTLPVFIELMIKKPSDKWGAPHYLPNK